MKIELLKTAMLGGNTNPIKRGSVIESDNPATIGEYKALVAVGYAKETNKAASKDAQFITPGGNTAPVSGIQGDAPDKAEAKAKGDAPANKAK